VEQDLGSRGGCDNVGVTIATDPPCGFVQLVRLERARLLDMLRSLSAEDWQRATPCPGWDVLGLVNHLVGDDLRVIAWRRTQRDGAPAPRRGGRGDVHRPTPAAVTIFDEQRRGDVRKAGLGSDEVVCTPVNR
jgi:uncharacterized protein (TIGR03083 family)